MAISSTAVRLSALALVAGGCGANTSVAAPDRSAPATSISQTVAPGGAGDGFSWLSLSRPPRNWPVVRIANGATMSYPAGWRRMKGDAGTATAVLQSADHDFIGYLNLTPHQGDESLRNWAAFRLGHNAEEGDRAVKALNAGANLRFRAGRGSCIRDAYTTATHARYIELACLVTGPRATTVIVGAAPPQQWARMSPLIERSISGLTT
jgi:hypothetical protein